MKLVNKHVEKDGSGYVTLRPEDDEDMWHVYNLVQPGDEVRAQAVRRVQTTSSTGSTDSSRVRLTLTIKVKKVRNTGDPGRYPSSLNSLSRLHSDLVFALGILLFWPRRLVRRRCDLHRPLGLDCLAANQRNRHIRK